jgi:hypothetical protein
VSAQIAYIDKIIGGAAQAAEDAVRTYLEKQVDYGMFDAPEPLFPNVSEATLSDLLSGLRLLHSDASTASVYLDRALRDFGEPGFHNGKLL